MTSKASSSSAAASTDEPSYPLLDRPSDGLPDVIAQESALMAATERFAAGSGPVALDAERASGYRYGSGAYLVQLRRAGAGTALIDPVACPDLSPLQEAIGDAEWVLHAATQDLPCLGELGLHPHRLFDTELGSRLAGLPRVALATVVEHYLGVTLAKEHSAVDWSTRPLPDSWLFYAALDVEVLVELRDHVRDDLVAQGKWDWASQEFEALTHFTGPPTRKDPWRRTSGMHRIRDRRAVARVRELWRTRDAIARRRDLAPGRVLPDALIVAMANSAPRTTSDLRALGHTASSARGRSRSPHRGLLRHQQEWLAAVDRVRQMPDKALPPATIRTDTPPPARAWADRDPVAAARLAEVREHLGDYADVHHVPVENLLTPSVLRSVLWHRTTPLDDEAVRSDLTQLGARPWQIDLATPLILQAADDHPADGTG